MRAIEDFERDNGFDSGKEVKGAQLIKSQRGRQYIASLIQLMAQKAIPYFYLAEKRFAVCAKIVESFYDPAYNANIENSELLDPDARQSWAQKFYEGPDQLIEEFAKAYQDGEAGAITANYQAWIEYFRQTNDEESLRRLEGIESTIGEDVGSESAAINEQITGWSSLNMPLFVGMFQDIENHFPVSIDLVHDSIKEFSQCFEKVFGLYKNAKPGAILFKDGRRINYGLENITSLTFASSEIQPLIRGADCMIAAVREYTKRAFKGESIDEYLTRAAHPAIGGWVCEMLTGMHPTLGGTPKTGTMMSSGQFSVAVFTRMMETMKGDADRQ